ncbi:MAG: flagellar biosynthesis protein FlhF, partial [Phycisphaerae bacterium]|nr:flagellar biosynthesis protein FlhF [Phycisphaerae bacterium]
MKIKTFESETMSGALKRVKRELGPAAVILHTRTYRRGGVMGFGSKPVVEITASDQVRIVPPNLRKRFAPGTQATASRLKQSGRTVGRPGGSSVLKRTYGKPAPAASPVPPTPERSVVGAPPSAPAAPAAPPVTPAPPAVAAEPGLNEEVRQIRRMVDRMLRRQTRRTDLPEKLFDQYVALLEQEVSDELAEEVIDNVRRGLDPTGQGSPTVVREALRGEMTRLIPVDAAGAGSTGPRPDGRPRTIALIGPTGVGKTTTVAKLAANFALRDKLKVALLTLDTFRIAAVDQLRTYADIIRVPLHVALTSAELAETLKRLKDFDVVLIDTAGRGQRDDAKLKQLQEMVEVADPHEVHLVLASTA